MTLVVHYAIPTILFCANEDSTSPQQSRSSHLGDRRLCPHMTRPDRPMVGRLPLRPTNLCSPPYHHFSFRVLLNFIPVLLTIQRLRCPRWQRHRRKRKSRRPIKNKLQPLLLNKLFIRVSVYFYDQHFTKTNK